MRVLGIDPGSRFLGYGVVEERHGRLSYVGHGVVRADEGPLEARLMQIFTELSAAARLFRPDAVAVEGVFACRNARSALILGHARGVALLVAAQLSIPVHEYAPARVKRAIGVGGRDGKDAVARMVTTLLEPPLLERSDASDALAVAVCHLNAVRVGPASLAARTVRRGSRKSKAVLLAGRLKPSYFPSREVGR